jgi:hypothetical protein
MTKGYSLHLQLLSLNTKPWPFETAGIIFFLLLRRSYKAIRWPALLCSDDLPSLFSTDGPASATTTLRWGSIKPRLSPHAQEVRFPSPLLRWRDNELPHPPFLFRRRAGEPHCLPLLLRRWAVQPHCPPPPSATGAASPFPAPHSDSHAVPWGSSTLVHSSVWAWRKGGGDVGQF